MKKRRSLWKAILFRVLAVMLGLSPLWAVEGACRLFDWGKPTDFDDPYVGFNRIQPLFVLNKKTQRYVIPESRVKFFNIDSFAAKKPANEFRIFVLGGSTVQGRPYKKETSFTTWMELSLNAADARHHWEVVNCGGISYASYRLVPILEEVLHYQPDLIIICTGHNEFLEDRTYSHIKNRSEVLTWPHRKISQLRTYNLLRGGWLALSGSKEVEETAHKPMLGAEVDARLDWKGGLEQYHRDESWRHNVMKHFAYNLSRMVVLAREADVPLFFVCPVSNLDWPPFKSEHGADLTTAERKEFDALLKQARSRKDLHEANALLQKAAEIDGRYALVHYEIGKHYLLLGRLKQAKTALERALEEDICPLRMLPPMRQDMLQIAEETETPLVNAHALFAAESPGGIPGARWLVDHVHPTIEGHQLLAEELFQEMARHGMVQPSSTWQEDRDSAYEKHRDSLPAGYFARGSERLKGLKRWASGKVKRDRTK